MNSTQLEDRYKPEVTLVEDFLGFSVNNAKPGEMVNVLQKAFLTSYEHSQMLMMTSAIRLFINNPAQVNSLLVIIRNNEARIYKKFPLSLSVKAKRNLKPGHVVFLNDIIDIEGVQFQDAIFSLDILDGDKFLWLFRKDFRFGLYFDFSGALVASQLSLQLGKHYKELEFYGIYTFFQQNSNCDLLIDRGWFPFIQLIAHGLDRLTSIKSNDDLNAVSDSLISEFTIERINDFVQQWWNFPVFNHKKAIISAGIQAYLHNDPASTINCIKNLVLEIEGIIRLSYHREFNKKPSTKDLKKYLSSKAQVKFSTENSLGFPGLFADYLNKVIFGNFDIENGDVSFSRHSIGHGVAPEALFTRERALQCILTLDQLYFYLGNS